jgi:SNF2 family DNA or RNA helicase
MSWDYSLLPKINLFVKGRIQEEDAIRQTLTAKILLERLHHQPGQILADEVGMGKTFVALAAAVSVALQDKEQRPVVVMIPPGLREKWPKDLSVFVQKCLPDNIQQSVRWGKAESNVAFLKLLDDEPSNRKNIIFLTHSALTRQLNDNWVKLLIIQRALYRRRNTEQVYKSLNRFGARLLMIRHIERAGDSILERLLNTPSADWKKMMLKSGIWDADKDDPVPQQITQTLYSIESSEYDGLLDLLFRMPTKESENIKARLSDFRQELNDALVPIWTRCLSEVSHSLPLLIMDEAHHLKNSKTQLARLFQQREENGSVSEGQLYDVFERMIFLTATPFQLGHVELCNILDRFKGINWANMSSINEDNYKNSIQELRGLLDRTQESALRFDAAWGNLKPEDMLINHQLIEDLELWWERICATPKEKLNLAQSAVVDRFIDLNKWMKLSETALGKYLIRHVKKQKLSGQYSEIDRRKTFPGSSIIDGSSGESGLAVEEEALLPFLLAARLSSLNPESRPIFAEGLASSYDAFLYTRKSKWEEDPTDQDEEYILEKPELDKESEWYLSQIESLVSASADPVQHPKVKATVDKVIELWKKGEKVLIFCHYIQTGKILHVAISRAMRELIEEVASRNLGCPREMVARELERIGTRFDEGYSLQRQFQAQILALIEAYDDLKPYSDELYAVITRYFRTPSFLVRFFPLSETKNEDSALEKAFETEDFSGLTLKNLIENFLSFLAYKCGDDERRMYLEALQSVQSGEIRLGKRSDPGTEDTTEENVLPNVRLVNGKTEARTRQNLMLTFNTPFYPDVLIATSVMAEGVDLHLNCRFIIHHDLCWNPSTLEQRTGRIDRIGAKVEQCGQPINIYHPYIAETQDEKIYKVVMDRARWFNILMGEKYEDSLEKTDKLADRLPLPHAVVRELSFKLDLEIPNYHVSEILMTSP